MYCPQISCLSHRQFCAGIAILLSLLLIPSQTKAQSIFDLFISSPNIGAPPDATFGGSSIPDLFNNALNLQGAFAGFSGFDWTANLDYAGIANAITIGMNAAGNSATITFNTIDGPQTFTFTGTDLFGQIEQFMQDNLANQLGAFIETMNALSLVAVTDGSPLSTTARSANYVFDRFGLHTNLTAAERHAALGGESKKHSQTRFDAYTQIIETDIGNGTSYSIVPSFEYAFNDQIALALMLPVSWHEIGGAEVVNIHGTLALPIQVIREGGILPGGVRVTPFASLSASGSADMIAGTLLQSYGFNATATLEFGDLLISGSTQLSVYEGVPFSIQGYNFDPGISQQILKNGVKATWMLGEHAYIYGSMTETSFLSAAAVDEYISPGGGFGIRKPNGFNLELGYKGDVATGYNAHEIRLTLRMPF